MFQYKSLHQFRWLSAILILAVLLTACGSSKSSVIGKWEVVSGTSVGTLYEFFQDGTVAVGGFASKYSWPDQTHMKIEMGGLGIVYECTLSGDELTLRDSSSQSVLTLKKYKEFNLNAQVIAGTWERSYPNNSGCFKGLGMEMTPQEIILGADGSFTLNDNVNLGIIGSGLSMNGQYTISGNGLHVTASGTQTNSGILGMGASQTQVQGEFNCAATISNSRLTFSDAQGQTVFTRAGR
ncbi:MAG: hypothetical protein KJ939_07920 [Nanoarchaeota archaeon]|nr:hypothetical protein [Nanoarchaeota archaeon]